MLVIANVALPSFLPHSMATFVGILLIAALEGWFIMRVLRLSYLKSYGHAFYANIMSTFVGIPVAWLLWLAGVIPISMGVSALGIEEHPALASTAMHTLIYGGIMPNEWTNVGMAAASLILLIPFWFGSAWIERKALVKRLPEESPAQISAAVVRGNLASYSIFFIIFFSGLLTAIADLPNEKQRFKESQERHEALMQELSAKVDSSEADPHLEHYYQYSGIKTLNVYEREDQELYLEINHGDSYTWMKDAEVSERDNMILIRVPFSLIRSNSDYFRNKNGNSIQLILSSDKLNERELYYQDDDGMHRLEMKDWHKDLLEPYVIPKGVDPFEAK